MNLFRKPDSQNWFYRFNLQGRRYQASTGTADKREAEKVMRRAWTVAEAASAPVPAALPTLAVLRDLDIARARESGSSPEYIRRSLQTHWNALIAHFGDAVSINYEALGGYVRERQLTTRNQTIARELTSLKRGIVLVADKYPQLVIHRWPSLRASPEVESRKGRFHELEPTRAWLRHLDGHAFQEALVMLLTGIRSWELSRVTASMVGAQVLSLTREITKNGKARQIGLVPRARKALLEGLPFDQRHQRTYKHAAVLAGIPGGIVHTRDLRATFATVAEEAGDSRGTDLVMGHGGEVAMRYQKAHVERIMKIARIVDEWLGEV